MREIRRPAVIGGVVLLLVAGIITGLLLRPAQVDRGTKNDHPEGASSAKAAVTEFFDALERRDGPAMRTVMTESAQVNEMIDGGLLASMPELTSYGFRGLPQREDPHGNASPAGAVASLRFTMTLSPAGGFSYDGTSGDAFAVLASESADHRWYVAELGGCC